MILSEITSKAISMQWKCTQHQTEMCVAFEICRPYRVYTTCISVVFGSKKTLTKQPCSVGQNKLIIIN